MYYFKKKFPFPFHALILLAILCTGFVCKKTQSHVPKIGIVNVLPTFDDAIAGFKKGMALRGYREHITVEYYYPKAAGIADSIPIIINQLIQEKVNCIVTVGNLAAIHTKELTKNNNTPVVMILANKPVENNIVQSYVSSKNNITGIHISGFVEKTAEWLIKTLPKAKNWYVPMNSDDPSALLAFKELEKLTMSHNITIISGHGTTRDEMDSISSSIPHESNAVFVLPVTSLFPYISTLVEHGASQGIPVISTSLVHLYDGVLLACSADLEQLGLQAAGFTAKILNGSAPENLPLESANFILGFNLKTAKKLHIDISDDILRYCDKIIR